VREIRDDLFPTFIENLEILFRQTGDPLRGFYNE
jgi:hypothetical protein